MYRSDDPGGVEHFVHLCPGSSFSFVLNVECAEEKIAWDDNKPWSKVKAYSGVSNSYCKIIVLFLWSLNILTGQGSSS
jgi:hypothetical protein